jgi:preprotein translocase subunit SecE
MVSATTEKRRERMAADGIASGTDGGGNQPRPRAHGAERTGFFHIYKHGQGYWTRVGTAIGAGLITILALQFLYTHLNVWLTPMFTLPNATDVQMAHAIRMARISTLSICGAFVLGMFLLMFYILNKPYYADFLIATDSEMKKVNWTSRAELMGSTKVVILFMFVIAALLFIFDLFFGYLFYFMDVLKTRPL